MTTTCGSVDDVACAVCLCPRVPADLAEELRQIYFTLRNHAYYMDYLRRQLVEMCVELERL